MINPRVEEALNIQINNEMASSYNYLAMSAYFETTPYQGFAAWMRKQSEEESIHAMKIYDYLNDRDGKISLKSIGDPTGEFDSALDVFKQSLSQEQDVTAQINDLYEIAWKEKDYSTVDFLGFFLEEQVEEEKVAQDMVDRLTLASDSPAALLQLDAEAAGRPAEEGASSVG
jgi:ferritin